MILFASFLFFALLTPVMLKAVLPMILSNQLSGEAVQGISGLIDMTQLDCVRNYMDDVQQIGTITVSYTHLDVYKRQVTLFAISSSTRLWFSLPCLRFTH